MSAADLYLMGVWQGEVGYNVAAAYAFRRSVDGWLDFVKLEGLAYAELSRPPVEWVESRRRSEGVMGSPDGSRGFLAS